MLSWIIFAAKCRKLPKLWKMAFRFGFRKSRGQVLSFWIFSPSKTYIMPIYEQLCSIGSQLLLRFKHFNTYCMDIALSLFPWLFASTVDSCENMWVNSICTVIAAWSNASQRSWVGVGMNRSAGRWRVKRFERSNGLDTALYEDTPFATFNYFFERTYHEGSSLFNSYHTLTTRRVITH